MLSNLMFIYSFAKQEGHKIVSPFLFVFLYSLPTQFSVLCKPNVNSMKRNFTIKFFMRCTGHDFYGVRGEGRWGEVRFKKTQLLVVSRKHPISVSLASPSVWHSTIGRTKKHGICPKNCVVNW